MPSLFVIGHLKTAGGAARQTVVDALTNVARHSEANEPGVYKFCVALPRSGDDKSVFAIEESVTIPQVNIDPRLTITGMRIKQPWTNTWPVSQLASFSKSSPPVLLSSQMHPRSMASQLGYPQAPASLDPHSAN